MRTWSFKFPNGKGLSIKAKKDFAQVVANAFSALARVGDHFISLYGEKPENETPEQFAEAVRHAREDSLIGWDVFGKRAAPEVPEIDAFWDALPELVEEMQARELAKEARRLLRAFCRVEDLRRTKAQDEESARITQQNKIDRENSLAAFLAEWSNGETVTVPEGKMAVILNIEHDDSDSLSDYFAYKTVGTALLLGIVPAGQRREATARNVLAAYPELAEKSWEWRDESYSMGRGYYLFCKDAGFNVEGVTTYGGVKNPQANFSIKFAEAGNYPAFRGYAGEQSQPEKVDGVTYSLNAEKNGVEIRFPEKPAAEVIGDLKANGFRWSPAGRLWYAKQSEGRIAFAQSLAQ